VGELTLIEKKIDPDASLPTMFLNVSDVYRQVMFEDFDLRKIRKFDEVDAVFCVSRLVAYISKHYAPIREKRGRLSD
jgi:hypothetical protein